MQRSLVATALVRGPCAAVAVCLFLPSLVAPGGPYAWLAGLPLAPALVGVHAAGRGERRRRTLTLAGMSLAAATAALLALWCAFFIALGLLYGPLPAD